MLLKKGLFSSAEKQKIVAAIGEAERLTSGQIKVHLEANCEKDALHRAIEVFHHLEMHKTTHKNAVLIYLAWKDKKFAIYGDTAIHKVVPANFWDGTKEVMKAHFKKGEFLEGVLFAIGEVGSHIQQYFPPHDGDKNELSNDISEG